MTGATTVIPLATFRNDTPYPFCPGCGHGPILDRLNEALVQLALDPRHVVLVSDIGCSGLSDQYFATSAFHGLHGRSITYASGIKLARPELTVIVIMGDGGTGIGGAHLLSAARRNIGITVLVLNNFNFGMTGGQHSTTTPVGANTSTTPDGNLERPLDICGTVAVNGASYVYRGTNFEPDLADRIAAGIRHDGFSLLDLWELCTAHFVPRNRLSRKALYGLLEDLAFPTGVLQERALPEFGTAYRAAHAATPAVRSFEPEPITVTAASALDRPFRIVLAGSAGARVGAAARVVARAAVASGLWAAIRNDYPVTVKTGHSISELILSPSEILYPGVTRPDVLVLLSDDGVRKATRYLRAMHENDSVLAVPGLAPIETRARVHTLDLAAAGQRPRKTAVALAAAGAVIRWLDILSIEALDAAAATGERSEEQRVAIGASDSIAALL